MKDKADEQLNEAYSRSVIVNASEIIIRPTVQGVCVVVCSIYAIFTIYQLEHRTMSFHCHPS